MLIKQALGSDAESITQTTLNSALDQKQQACSETEKNLRRARLYLRFFPFVLQGILVLAGWYVRKAVLKPGPETLLALIAPVGFIVSVMGWRQWARAVICAAGGKTHFMDYPFIGWGGLYMMMGNGLPDAYKRGELWMIAISLFFLSLLTMAIVRFQIGTWKQKRKPL